MQRPMMFSGLAVRASTLGKHVVRFAKVLQSRPLLWPLAGAFGLVLVDVVMWTAASLVYRLDTTTPEGSIVYSIIQVAHGGSLYRDYSAPPYSTTPYPPLLYLVSGAIAAAFGGGIDAAYCAGRAVATFSAVACLALLALLARRIGTPPRWVVATVIVASTVTALRPWAFTCRPDVPAIALSLAGVYFLLARPTARGTLVAGLFFLAGLYTKQTVLSAPVVMGATLLWRREWRRFAVLGATMVLGGAALIGLTDLVTGGRFTLNVVRANVAPAMWDQPWEFFINFYVKGAGISLFFSALALLGIGRDWSGQAIPRLSEDSYPLAAYALLSLLVAVALSVKAGADANYFIEPGLVVSVFAGQGLRHLNVFMRRGRIAQIAVVVCLLFVFDVVRNRFANMWLADIVYQAPRQPEVVLARLKEVPGDVLFSDAGLALRSGRKVLLLDPFNASYLSDKGLINFRPLVERIENREIAAIVSERGPYANIRGQLWWPRDVARAIYENYEFKSIMFDYVYIYVPKSRATPPAQPVVDAHLPLRPGGGSGDPNPASAARVGGSISRPPSPGNPQYR